MLAQTFDADPFLLSTLRGRDREALLAGLRAQRAGTPLTERTVETTDDPIPVDALRAQELLRAAGSLADIAVRPDLPDGPGAVLRRLGPPPGLEEASGELQAAVSDAAAVAWELLDSVTGQGPATRYDLSRSPVHPAILPQDPRLSPLGRPADGCRHRAPRRSLARRARAARRRRE